MDNAAAGARGLGRSVIPTIIVIMGTVVFRIVWVCTIFASIHTLMSLYLVYASAWAFTSIIGTVYFIIIYQKDFEIITYILQKLYEHEIMHFT